MNPKQLQALRRLHGMTRKQFADHVRISEALVKKIERREWHITQRTATKVLSAFKVTERELSDLSDLQKQLTKGMGWGGSKQKRD